MQYLIAFCTRPEIASDVIASRFVRPIVRDKRVKCCDPRLNRCRAIPTEAVGGFNRFLNFDNYQPEASSDVISSTAVQYVGIYVRVKFGDSRLKSSEASSSAVFRTSITSDRKPVVRLYPVWL